MAIGIQDNTTSNLSRTANLPTSGSYTIAVWVKRRSFRASQFQYFLALENAAEQSTAYHLTGWTSGQAMQVGNQTYNTTFGTDIADDTWYYVWMRSNGTNHEAGRAAQGAGSFTKISITHAATSSSLMRLGSDSWNEYCLVNLAYARVWTTALTDEELLAEMNSAVAIKTANLNIDSPLTDNTHVQDNSGNGYDWTIGGGGVTSEASPFHAATVNESITVSESVTVQIAGQGPPAALSISINESITVQENQGIGRYHQYGSGARLFNIGNTNPRTANFTCDAGSTALVLTISYGYSADRTGGSPTYNGVAFTQVDSNRRGSASPEAQCEMWVLFNPPTGSSLQISIPNAGFLQLWAVAGTAKAPTGSRSAIDVTNGASAVGTNPGTTVTPGSHGSIVFEVVAGGWQTWNPTAQTGVAIDNYDPSSYGGGTQYHIRGVPAAATEGYTHGTSEDYGLIYLALKAIPCPSINESITVGESVTVQVSTGIPPRSVSVTEPVTVGESVTARMGAPLSININESITVGESVTVQNPLPPRIISINEPVYVTEIPLTGAGTLALSVAQSVTINETVTLAPSPIVISIAESLTVGETVQVALGTIGAQTISVNESLTVGETVQVALAPLVISIVEPLTVGEVVQGVLAPLTLTQTETINVGETVQVSLPLAVGVTETVTTGEVVQVNRATSVISIGESVTVGEVVQVRIPSLTVGVTETVTTGEVVQVRNTNLSLGVQDGISVAESVTVSLPAIGSINVSISEPVTVGETVQVALAPLTLTQTETITVGETVQVRNSTLVVVVTETVTTGELVQVNPSSLTVAVVESVTMGETVQTRIPTLSLGVQDTITVGESLGIIISIPGVTQIGVIEGIGVAETVQVTVGSLRITALESITLTETPQTRVNLGGISVTESVIVVLESADLRETSHSITITEPLTVGESVGVNIAGIAPLTIAVQDLVTVMEITNSDMGPLEVAVAEGVSLGESVLITGLSARNSALFKGMYRGMMRRMN